MNRSGLSFFVLALCSLLVAGLPTTAHAQRDSASQVLLGPLETVQLAALRAADDERVAAVLAADRTRLEAIISDDLYYAHSNGTIDTKASFIESLTSRRSVYKSVEYTQHRFIPAGPGVVVMAGRALIRAGGPDRQNLLDLNFLAVWREERGKWRFLAWQSCRNAPAPAAPAAK